MTPIVLGIAGPVLAPDERAAIVRVQPAGVILFGRNVVDPVQLRALTDDLRDATGRSDLAVMIDQEGGPVARLRPPHWPAFPAGPLFAAAYARAPMTAIRAAHAHGEALGRVLAAAGITLNCAPMLDVAQPGSDASIATRVLGDDPMTVAALGRAVIEGMADAGVGAIVKHLPGYGRATVDPHRALPVVTADAAALESDLAPFRRVLGRFGSGVAGMVGHVVYTAWDADRPASLSPAVIDSVIRGAIGFDGLLLSDDLHMDALAGPIEERAAAAIAAGCDLALCCHVTPDQALRIGERIGAISAVSAARLARVRAAPVEAGDPGEAIVRRDTLLMASNDAVRLALPAGNA